MNSTVSVLIFIAGALVTAISQTLLKISANREHKSRISEYLNPYVIGSYILLALVLGMNVIGYQWIEYKYGSIINCLSYVFILLLGFGFLKEKITWRKIVGNIVIIAGIIVFAF
ncbi:MAG: EamA family transporter [Bacillota bacterium]